MTTPRAAQEKPTSPHTHKVNAGCFPSCPAHYSRAAAAATPSLDVERLAQWLHEDRIGCSIRCRPFSDGGGQYVACEGPNDHKWQAMTLLARLDEGSATPPDPNRPTDESELDDMSDWADEGSATPDPITPPGIDPATGMRYSVDADPMEGSATPEQKR